jgi:hypothetical protein
MLTLADNPQETLTHKLWEQWKTAGYNDRPNSLTWLEVSNLTAFFLKICREKNLDWQSLDFRNMIDPTLNYYENQSAIAEAVGEPLSAIEQEAYKDYMDKVASEAQTEIETAEQLAEKNAVLERQNRKLKAKETETLDSQQIKAEIQQINHNQAAILNKLEQLPNLNAQIQALKQSQNFKDLGHALSPVATKPVKTLTNDGDPNKPLHYTPHGEGIEYCQYCGAKLDAQAVKCWNCNAPIKQPKKPALIALIEILKPKNKSASTVFAGAMVLVIWIAATGWMLTNFELNWITVIGLAVFWMLFVVAYKVVVGDL